MKKFFSLLFLFSVFILAGCMSQNTTNYNQDDNNNSDIKYSVEYVDYDGTVLQTEDYDFGADLSGVTSPTDPSREGYTFDGWDTTLPSTMRTSKITITATYTINQYTLEYVDYDGTVIQTADYNFGADLSGVTAPTDPNREGYTFDGWDKTVPAIMPAGNLTITATYSINQYTVTYVTYNDFDLATDIVFNPGETIISTSLGYAASAIVTSEGRAFVWGLNGAGQLGDGTTTNRLSPVDITAQFNLSEGEKVISISLGYMFSAAITSEGRLFMWGQDGYGKLGSGNSSNMLIPIDITPLFNLDPDISIIAVELGTNHALALTSERRVYSWGDNQYGQCGYGELYSSSVPVDITDNFNLESGEQVISIAAGSNHSAALTTNGSIFTWGQNGNGRIGDGSTENKLLPTDITANFLLNSDELVTDVSLGNFHSAALTSDGRLFTWGYNGYGQLGIITDGDYVYKPMDITSQFNLDVDEQLISIELGDNFSTAITSQGRDFTWGVNYNKQLGFESTNYYIYNPTDITNNFGLDDGEKILSINVGDSHSSAITSNGRLYLWGYGACGQLGDGTTTFDRSSPMSLGTKSAVSVEVVIVDDNEMLSEYTPTREGYTFDGWYIDLGFSNLYTGTIPVGNITLYGKWIPN